MEIKVDNTHVVKLEDGDILHVTVPIDTRYEQVLAFRKHLEKEVKEKVGDRCIVIVTASEPGTVEVKAIKRNELSDIYQRLDALESKR